MERPVLIEREDSWDLHCPATHGWINIPRDGRWTFDGNYARPTFGPSYHEKRSAPGTTHPIVNPDFVNHLYVRAGNIEYLGDCTHAMRGQTVPVPPLTDVEVQMHWPEYWEETHDA